ncbi:MAG TPA: DUF177 domain-containing protein [Gaiellaceae bacterium]|nr:DUF177 domain-containing protein [Gaiellaceae bacterium]
MTSFDLRRVKLRPGEEHREALEVELPVFEFAAQRYLPVPENVVSELVVMRALTGTVFALAFRTRLHGPCYRCLGEAVLELRVNAHEYQASSPDDDELRTPYLANDVLDVSGWARDAVVLALPDKILCRADCAGLCPECGKNLNEEPHEHEETTADSRWQALEALRDGDRDASLRDDV